MYLRGKKHACWRNTARVIHWKITRLWNVTYSASPSFCVRMSVFLCLSVRFAFNVFLFAHQSDTAIPHLCVPTKFMIRKKHLSGCSPSRSWYPQTFPIFRLFACFLSSKKGLFRTTFFDHKKTQVENLYAYAHHFERIVSLQRCICLSSFFGIEQYRKMRFPKDGYDPLEITGDQLVPWE